MRRIFLSVVAALLLISSVAFAHHSYAATYDVSKEVRLEGKLVQFNFKNPHSYVTIQTKDTKGEIQRWSVEWAGSSQLNNSGIKAETLKVGDEIVIVGRPSRVPGEFRCLMVNLKRPSDGFTWGNKGEVVE